MASPKLRAFRDGLLVRLLFGFAAVARHLPLRAGRRIGAGLGRLAWHVARRERNKALAQIASAFPDWPETKRRATIRAMFRHLGVTLFEVLWLPNLTAAERERTTVIEGREHIEAALAAGRGVLAVTGHCGNWEWLAASAASLGWPVAVLQRERNEGQLNDLITGIRAPFGISTIDRGSMSSARDMFAMLRRGGIIAFLLDQNIRTESVKVPFFGRPALTPIGPAKLAVRTGSAVVPVFIERLADGRQRIHFEPARYPAKGDDPVELTAWITARIEAQIRQAPEQWVWMHERWRERPQWDVSQEG